MKIDSMIKPFDTPILAIIKYCRQDTTAIIGIWIRMAEKEYLLITLRNLFSRKTCMVLTSDKPMINMAAPTADTVTAARGLGRTTSGTKAKISPVTIMSIETNGFTEDGFIEDAALSSLLLIISAATIPITKHRYIWSYIKKNTKSPMYTRALFSIRPKRSMIPQLIHEPIKI